MKPGSESVAKRLRALLVGVAVSFAGCGIDAQGTLVDVGNGGPLTDAGSSQEGGGGEGAPHCVPKGPEICTDGIDNDCNGAVDCQDAACTAGFTCVPGPSSGWTPVAYDANDRAAACPAGYGSPATTIEDPKGADAACSCGCALATAPSCDGVITLSVGQPFATCTLFSGSFGAVANACVTTAQNPQGNAGIRVTPAAVHGGTCTTTPGKIVPALTYGAQGQACALASPVGGGCGAGHVCAPKPASPFGACVSSPAVTACPAGFPAAHVVGSQAADSRDCSACGCGVSGAACLGRSLTLYSDGACATPVISFPADDVCYGNQNGFNEYSYKYSATPTGTCTANAPSTPIGGVVLANAHATCCQ